MDNAAQAVQRVRRFATADEASADYARKVLSNVGWNISVAAFELDINRRTLLSPTGLRRNGDMKVLVKFGDEDFIKVIKWLGRRMDRGLGSVLSAVKAIGEHWMGTVGAEDSAERFALWERRVKEIIPKEFHGVVGVLTNHLAEKLKVKVKWDVGKTHS